MRNLACHERIAVSGDAWTRTVCIAPSVEKRIAASPGCVLLCLHGSQVEPCEEHNVSACGEHVVRCVWCVVFESALNILVKFLNTFSIYMVQYQYLYVMSHEMCIINDRYSTTYSYTRTCMNEQTMDEHTVHASSILHA